MRPTFSSTRVEPAQVFGLELGDAIVARTVGGRVTPAVLEDLAWNSYLHETKTPEAEWFELPVVHHTDCGAGFFADERLQHSFVARTHLDEAGLAELAVLGPDPSLRTIKGPGLFSRVIQDQNIGFKVPIHHGR
jgi:carbonic anhydrase